MRDPLNSVLPLADPRKSFSWWYTLQITTGVLGLLGFGLAAWLANEPGVEIAQGTLVAAGLFTFLTLVLGPWSTRRLLVPRQRPNALYLRSFKSDSAAVELRRRLQAALGSGHRLEGIRQPKLRVPPLLKLLLAPWWPFLYANESRYGLEAGNDWVVRLWKTLSDCEFVFLDLRERTTAVDLEQQLALATLGPRRTIAIVDDLTDLRGVHPEQPVLPYADAGDQRGFGRDVRRIIKSMQDAPVPSSEAGRDIALKHVKRRSLLGSFRPQAGTWTLVALLYVMGALYVMYTTDMRTLLARGGVFHIFFVGVWALALLASLVFLRRMLALRRASKAVGRVRGRVPTAAAWGLLAITFAAYSTALSRLIVVGLANEDQLLRTELSMAVLRYRLDSYWFQDSGRDAKRAEHIRELQREQSSRDSASKWRERERQTRALLATGDERDASTAMASLSRYADGHAWARDMLAEVVVNPRFPDEMRVRAVSESGRRDAHWESAYDNGDAGTRAVIVEHVLRSAIRSAAGNQATASELWDLRGQPVEQSIRALLVSFRRGPRGAALNDAVRRGLSHARRDISGILDKAGASGADKEGSSRLSHASSAAVQVIKDAGKEDSSAGVRHERPGAKLPPGAFTSRYTRGPSRQARAFDARVQDALHWLASHQSPNGGWEAANFMHWCDGKRVQDASKRPDGAGKALYDPGVSGMSLCAFLGAGYTNRGKHDFARVVGMGLRYLINIQDPEGCFGPRSTQQYIYNHATSSLAMVEAYGMTGSPIFKGSAQRALDFIALSRNPYFAWRYGIKPGDNDTSVTGWMMMALKSAKIVNEDAVSRGKPAPLVVDESAFEGIKDWLEKVTDPDYGKVGYLTRGSGSARPGELLDRFPAEKSEAMTAVGMLARTFIGEDPAKSAVIKKGAELCVKLVPTWNTADGSIDMYYWYYATLAMFQVGGKHWDKWKAGMEKAMVENQRKETTFCEYKGSWDPVGPWGLDGGRVYSTAILALCLEVSYRYDKIFGAK